MPNGVETIWGKFDKFAPPELANTGVGILAGAFGHMILESAFDNFLKSRYPENYILYSTGLTSLIFIATGAALYWYGRRPGWAMLQYIAGGILLSELVQIADIIHVSFELGR